MSLYDVPRSSNDNISDEDTSREDILESVEAPLSEAECIEDPEDGEYISGVPTVSKLPDEANLKLAGYFKHRVGNKYIVESIKDQPILDFETELFLENRNVLGSIHDIYGVVANPKYSISCYTKPFPDIVGGCSIYYTDYYAGNTRFVNISSVMSIIPTDASWESDHEMPPEMIEYSDDEKERSSKGRKKTKPKKKREISHQPPVYANENYSNYSATRLSYPIPTPPMSINFNYNPSFLPAHSYQYGTNKDHPQMFLPHNDYSKYRYLTPPQQISINPSPNYLSQRFPPNYANLNYPEQIPRGFPQNIPDQMYNIYAPPNISPNYRNLPPTSYSQPNYFPNS